MHLDPNYWIIQQTNLYSLYPKTKIKSAKTKIYLSRSNKMQKWTKTDINRKLDWENTGNQTHRTWEKHEGMWADVLERYNGELTQ